MIVVQRTMGAAAQIVAVTRVTVIARNGAIVHKSKLRPSFRHIKHTSDGCHPQFTGRYYRLYVDCPHVSILSVPFLSFSFTHKQVRSFLPLCSRSTLTLTFIELLIYCTYRRVFRLAMAPDEGSSTLVLNTSLAPADTAKSAERVLLTIQEMYKKKTIRTQVFTYLVYEIFIRQDRM